MIACMSTGHGIAMAGLIIAVAMIACTLLWCVAWRDAAKEAGSNTELTPPPRPGQSGRRR